MRARCLSTQLSQEQRELCKANELFKTQFEITIGKEYPVYGIQFVAQSNVYGCNTLLEIEDNAGRLISTPAMLFEITDPRVSKAWKARKVDDTAFLLWPAEFQRDYFYDDLSNGKREAISAFAQVKESFRAEFGS